MVWATDAPPTSSQPIYGARLLYPPASWSKLGNGCSGAVACTNNGAAGNPNAGSEFFALEVTNAAPSQLYVLFLATSAVPGVPLSPGCNLYLNLTQPVLQGPTGLTSASGSMHTQLSLPDAPAVFGDVVAQ